MFYLLEDNRIIDSEKYINSILNKGKNSEKNYEYLYEIRNGQSYYYGKIKKQSENVYDLIEKGDLIKVEVNKFCPRPQMIFDVNSIFTYDDGVKEFSIMGMSFQDKKVLAIYKPDAQGNYIKVWEKKEDE